MTETTLQKSAAARLERPLSNSFYFSVIPSVTPYLETASSQVAPSQVGFSRGVHRNPIFLALNIWFMATRK